MMGALSFNPWGFLDALEQKAARERMQQKMIEFGIVRPDDLLIGPKAPEAYIEDIRKGED